VADQYPPGIDRLYRVWKEASDKSQAEAITAQAKAIAAGAPPNLVTLEYMRFLVLQWVLEIEGAKVMADVVVEERGND